MDHRIESPKEQRAQVLSVTSLVIGRDSLMNDSSFRQDLQGFAVELRKLAYTMPAGHEDRLIHLSERMAAYSRQNREIDWRGA
jgi:hypothetical protein